MENSIPIPVWFQYKDWSFDGHPETCVSNSTAYNQEDFDRFYGQWSKHKIGSFFTELKDNPYLVDHQVSDINSLPISTEGPI